MKIPGVDFLVGLEQANHDEELYGELLEIYYEDGVEMLKAFKKDLQHSDLQLFIVNTHAIKSASLNIGAVELSAKFKEMEFAGKDKDMDTIEEKFPAYLQEFEELLGHLKEYLENGGSQETDEAPDALFVKKMKSALEEMETDLFEELMEQALNANYSSEAHARLEGIQAAYDDFDFQEATRLLDELFH